MAARRILLGFVAAIFVGCGGGGGGGGSSLPAGGGGAAPTPTPAMLPASITMTTLLGPATSVVFGEIASGALGSISFPATSAGSANASLTLQSSLPSGAPVPSSALRHRLNLGGNVTALAYISVTPAGALSFSTSPGFSMTFPQGALSGSVYVAFYNPANASAGWNVLLGPISGSGTSASFASAALPQTQTLSAGQTVIYAIVETGTPLPTPTPSPTPVAGNGAPLTGPNFGPSNAGSAWGPTALANALSFPVQTGFNGSGWTVAIVIDSNVNGSDIAAYTSYFLTPTTSRTIQYELIDGASSTPGLAQQEATLDTETIAGLAPGANIIIYVIPDLTDVSIIDAYNQIITDNRARVVSSSFAGCEPPYSGESAVFQSGTTQGIAFVASAGDEGNECGSTLVQPGVGYPASDPNVIGVGGTETLRTAFTLTSTTAWNDFNCGSGTQCATGGGVSTFFPLPPYQSGITGVASTSFRNVPDVAMPAEFDAVYLSGQWAILNGTSWSAPAFAAMLSEVFEYCNVSFTNPVQVPYYVFGTSRSAFIDVTSGNNQFNGTTPYYAAHSGYDNVSGLGVPLGMPFAQTVCPNRVPASRARGAALSVAELLPAQAVPIDFTPRLRGLTDIGRRPADEQTLIQLVLRPSSSLAQDEQTAIGVLRAAGFTIKQTFSNHLVIDATSSTTNIDRLFSTELHNVSQGRYGIRYAPVDKASIPASLSPFLAGLTLDNVINGKHASL